MALVLTVAVIIVRLRVLRSFLPNENVLIEDANWKRCMRSTLELMVVNVFIKASLAVHKRTEDIRQIYKNHLEEEVIFVPDMSS